MAAKKLNVKDSLKKNIFVPLSTEFLRRNNILEPEKIDIIEHPAKRKYWIGAKNSGKTIASIIDTIIFHENNVKGSSFAGRKYAYSAAEKMGGYFARALKLLREYGYNPRYQYEQKRNRYYSKKSNKDMKENSYQQYFSLEDISATDGSAPENLGFYGVFCIDEPIHKDDVNNPDKIPSPEQWESDLEQLRSNLERYNAAFLNLHPNIKEIKTKEWYTMNDWGNHPLSVYIHSVFPQSAFVKQITGYTLEELLNNSELIKKLCKSRDEEDPNNLVDSEWGDIWIKNHTFSVYDFDPANDKDDLIIRSTKFGNPDERVYSKANSSLKKIAKGLIEGNWSILAHYAGLQYTPRISNELLVYNINNFNETTMEELNKEGWYATKLSYGVDIDTSRVFTITPAYEMRKDTRLITGSFKSIKAVFIDKQMEIAAMGTGEFGELNELSAKQISLRIKKHFLEALKNPLINETLEKTYCVVDDNRKHYLNDIKKFLPSYMVENFLPAVKQGHYEIIDRQDYFEESFKQKKMFLHKDNKMLKNDILNCVKSSPNASVRTTAGTINYLDRLDSAEYAAYPFISIMAGTNRPNIYKQNRKIENIMYN